ncbi:hypothetical protein DdX_08001 [Ditylenchus destructor]|uniref:Uncharacterized protein n=1 Tax=Ditylenchus destructor TaxID=166010 RepID=A0AAD4N833_9BILA|nr:hypothetical protein DdX_08001 [Ditylenchus destructor]
MQRKKHKLRFPAVRHTKTHDIFGSGTSKSSDRPAVFDVSHESDETFVDTNDDGTPATFGAIQHMNKDGDKKSDANFYDDYFADFGKCGDLLEGTAKVQPVCARDFEYELGKIFIRECNEK